MLYEAVANEAPLSQGDLVDDCPILLLVTYMRIGLPEPYATQQV
jgi:hypothetical protein